MGLNIKNADVEKLADEVARLCGETKTEAIRRALADRLTRLRGKSGNRGKRESLVQYFERTIWPQMPPGELGRRLTREQEEEILGYGPEGV